MVESLQNLEAVYAKWQSRNPYLHSSQPGNKQSGLHTRDGGGDACPIWQKSWPSNLGSSLRPSARHLATKHRGRNRRENGLTDADELMVCFSGLHKISFIFFYKLKLDSMNLWPVLGNIEYSLNLLLGSSQ